jgi:hypothetical protein
MMTGAPKSSPPIGSVIAAPTAVTPGMSPMAASSVKPGVLNKDRTAY